MEMKLQVVIVPVSDVERAKSFYVGTLGFSLDVDYAPTDEFRVVQVTPLGSAVSVQFGIGLTKARPGSLEGLYLVVNDIVAVQEQVASAGAQVGELRHKEPLAEWAGGFAGGPEQGRADYATFFDVSDPDGNVWTFQEIGHG